MAQTNLFMTADMYNNPAQLALMGGQPLTGWTPQAQPAAGNLALTTGSQVGGSGSSGQDWQQFWQGFDPKVGVSGSQSVAFPGGNFQDYLGYLQAAPDGRMSKFRSWLGSQLGRYANDPNSKMISGGQMPNVSLGELRDWYTSNGGQLPDAEVAAARESIRGGVREAATGTTQTGSNNQSQLLQLLASSGLLSSNAANYLTGGTGGLTADQALAYGAGDIDYLRGIAANAGYATDATPAWLASILAQQYNLDRGAADLAEQYNVSGNRFSTAFGTGMSDYWRQAMLDQNSNLANLTLQSQEAARGRETSAAQTLASLGQSGLSQLSSQDFQALMQSQNLGYNASSLMAQLQAQAASQLSSQGVTGAQGLYSTENQAALAELQRQLTLQQLGLSGASTLGSQWLSQLGLGSALGGQQYDYMNQELQAAYNEWLRTQQGYNPMLAYISAAATGYPNMYYPSYQPSETANTIGGLGSILSLLMSLGN